VVGHANKRGSDKSAASLARRRVAAVTKLLLLLGARPTQVVIVATPRLHTVSLGSTPRERLQRRVVVVFRHEPPRGEQRQAKPSTVGGGRAGRRQRERVAMS
jgi:outer membrane protein OmpA-like peptidoglycan-associated protein